MSTARQRAAQELRIKHAMASLVRNTEFKVFIDTVRANRDATVDDACNDVVVASQRMSMAAIGEIRAYNQIIAAYDEFVARAVDEGEAAPD